MGGGKQRGKIKIKIICTTTWVWGETPHGRSNKESATSTMTPRNINNSSTNGNSNNCHYRAHIIVIIIPQNVLSFSCHCLPWPSSCVLGPSSISWIYQLWPIASFDLVLVPFLNSKNRTRGIFQVPCLINGQLMLMNLSASRAGQGHQSKCFILLTLLTNTSLV